MIKGYLEKDEEQYTLQEWKYIVENLKDKLHRRNVQIADLKQMVMRLKKAKNSA